MEIDFEEASKEWRKNKTPFSKGYFKYKCEKCDDCVYNYVVTNKRFELFASEFDLTHKNHENRHRFCEEHLLDDS